MSEGLIGSQKSPQQTAGFFFICFGDLSPFTRLKQLQRALKNIPAASLFALSLFFATNHGVGWRLLFQGLSRLQMTLCCLGHF